MSFLSRRTLLRGSLGVAAAGTIAGLTSSGTATAAPLRLGRVLPRMIAILVM